MRGLLLLPETLTRKEVLHVWRIPFAPAPYCRCDDSLHRWKLFSQDSRQSPNFSARPNSTAVVWWGHFNHRGGSFRASLSVKKPHPPMWTLTGTGVALFPLTEHFSGFYREKRAGLSPASLSLWLSFEQGRLLTLCAKFRAGVYRVGWGVRLTCRRWFFFALASFLCEYITNRWAFQNQPKWESLYCTQAHGHTFCATCKDILMKAGDLAVGNFLLNM